MAVSQGMRTLQRGGPRASSSRTSPPSPKSSAASTPPEEDTDAHVHLHRHRRRRRQGRRARTRRRASARSAPSCSATGLHPTRGAARRRASCSSRSPRRSSRRKELMHFTRQLAVFVRAGIPILEGLDVIAEEATEQGPPPGARRTCATRCAAARPSPTRPPSTPRSSRTSTSSVLRSAEMTGNLDTVLDQLADYIERDLEARRKIVSALVYPAIVVVDGDRHRRRAHRLRAAAVRDVLRRRSTPSCRSPPGSCSASPTSCSTWGWLIARRSPCWSSSDLSSCVRTDTRPSQAATRCSCKLPASATCVRYAILERFCRILGSMVTAGVPLPDALAVTGDVTNNAVYREGLLEAREAMLRGEGLAGPLAATGLFPGAARQMFRVGEETGTLDDQLETAAKYYDRELDYKIKRFTEPLRAGRHHLHGRRRRLRRHRPGVGDVRHLQPEHRRGLTVQRALSEARARRLQGDEGVGLVEVLVTVSLVGIAFVAILGALAVVSKTSRTHQVRADANTVLVSAAEAVKGLDFCDPDESCNPAATYEAGLNAVDLPTGWERDNIHVGTITSVTGAGRLVQDVTLELVSPQGRGHRVAHRGQGGTTAAAPGHDSGPHRPVHRGHRDRPGLLPGHLRHRRGRHPARPGRVHHARSVRRSSADRRSRSPRRHPLAGRESGSQGSASAPARSTSCRATAPSS